MTTIQEAAEQALNASDPMQIPYFAYHGDVDFGGTWAWTFSRSRDADLLEESNFEVISKDMEERFPDDVFIDCHSHWAVGWVELIAVRVLDDDGEITDAFLAIDEWAKALENYPVADDSDFSEREYEASINDLEWATPNNMIDDLPEDWQSILFSALWDSNIYYEDGWNSKDVEAICQELGWLEDE
jgi:hypothetical protein